VGEIIAHQLPHNNLGDITRNMDALTGGNLLEAVQRELDAQTQHAKERTIEASWVPQFVVRTFELRHIFCHELATTFAVRLEEIDRCFRATFAFLYCSEGYVQTLLRP